MSLIFSKSWPSVPYLLSLTKHNECMHAGADFTKFFDRWQITSVDKGWKLSSNRIFKDTTGGEENIVEAPRRFRNGPWNIWNCFVYVVVNLVDSFVIRLVEHACTVLMCRMLHRKWRQTKHKPGRAKSCHQLSYWLLSLHFLWGILCTSMVVVHCRSIK